MSGHLRIGRGLRRLVFFAHLWLGLILGGYLVLLGLTGSLLVFAEEIDVALNPRLHWVTPGGSRITLDEAYAVARRRHPEPQLLRIMLPQNSAAPYELQFGSWERAPWSSASRTRLLQVYVNPYTGEVLGERPYQGAFFNLVLYLHMDLLLGMGGYLLNGYGALLCGGLLCSGLWLWWPSVRGFWRQWAARMRVQRGASYRRLLHDLHNVFGIYAVPVLLVSVLTGSVFVFWEPVQTVVYRLARSPADPPPVRVNSARISLSLDRALAVSGGLVQEAHPTRLFPAAGPGKPFRVLLEFPEGHLSHGAFAQVHLDPDTGAVARIDDPRSASLGSQLMGWVGPLHFGTWAGCFGAWPKLAVKTLYMLAGLAPLALFVTGGLKYLAKRRARRKNRLRHQGPGRGSGLRWRA